MSLIIEQWFDRDMAAPTSAPAGAINGCTNPAAVAYGTLSAALAASGLLCASSVAFASGTVTYAASGISAPSSVVFGNETSNDADSGLIVASSVAFADGRVTYAASGVSAPSSDLYGSASAELALSGLSNPSSVLTGDLQLAAATGAIDGRSVPSSVAMADASASLALAGQSNAATVLLAGATSAVQASGLSVSATVAYADLQLLAEGAISGISNPSLVAFGDVSITYAPPPEGQPGGPWGNPAAGRSMAATIGWHEPAKKKKKPELSPVDQEIQALINKLPPASPAAIAKVQAAMDAAQSDEEAIAILLMMLT